MNTRVSPDELIKIKNTLFTKLYYNKNYKLIDNKTYHLKLSPEGLLQIIKDSMLRTKQEEIDVLTSSIKNLPMMDESENAYQISTFSPSNWDHEVHVTFSPSVSEAIIYFYMNEVKLPNSQNIAPVPQPKVNLNRIYSIFSTVREQLTAILQDYQNIANLDPAKLRLAIPSKEVWRFFVDGDIQEEGRQLRRNKIFQKRLDYYGSMLIDDLDYTISSYVNGVEKSHFPCDTLKSSELMTLLTNAKWELTYAEFYALKLQDLLDMDKAWIPFERNEPGYLKALVNGFQFIFDLSTPLTLDFIKKIHKVCVQNVDTNYNKNKLDKPGEFRTEYSNVFFGMNQDNATQAGLYEFLSHPEQKSMHKFANMRFLFIKLKNNQCLRLMPSVLFPIINSLPTNHVYSDEELCNLFIDCLEDKNNNEFPADDIPFLRKLITIKDEKMLAAFLYQEIKNKRIIYFKSQQENHVNKVLNKVMQDYLDQYTKEIHQAKDAILKLHAIIKFIQSIEQQHPNIDGNCRAYCMVLLNILLVRNGFPLAILDDPNRFDMYGKSELLHELLKGMDNTFKLIRNGCLFNVSTDHVIDYLKRTPVLSKYLSYFNEVVAIEEAARMTPTYRFNV